MSVMNVVFGWFDLLWLDLLWVVIVVLVFDMFVFDVFVLCDVVIVGVGFMGLLIVFYLVECGVNVCVIDGVQLGWGVFGCNGGQVIFGLKYDFDEFVCWFGDVVGEQFVGIVGGVVDIVFDLIVWYVIDCDVCC